MHRQGAGVLLQATSGPSAGLPILQRIAEDGRCPLGIGIVQSLMGRDAETLLVEAVKVPVTRPNGDERGGG